LRGRPQAKPYGSVRQYLCAEGQTMMIA
jgi:hypothetical protein